jgi:hypothetical protein
MSSSLPENISDQELINRITSRNVTEFDLMKEFQISDSALRKYKKNNQLSKGRISEPRKKLLLLEFSLAFLEKKGLSDPFVFLKDAYVDEVPLLKFINDYAKDRSIFISIKQVLNSKVGEVKTNALDRYRAKYKFLNDETLVVASKQDPELLKELIEDKELRPSTRADILEALAVGARDDYFNYLLSKCEETSPHIREAAFNGLYEYFVADPKYYSLMDHFSEKFKSESAAGVKITLKNLMEEMRAA